MNTATLADVLAKLQEADTLIKAIVQDVDKNGFKGFNAEVLGKSRTLIRDVGFTLACDTVIGAVGASTDGK